MNETPMAPLDQAAFQRVWRRVMPEDRPDCPIALDPVPLAGPAQPPPLTRASLPAPAQKTCLGEGSAGELPTLEALLDATVGNFRQYRALRRRGMGAQKLLSALTAAKEYQARRLSTANFLISGQTYVPAPTPASTAQTLPLALRERFQAEQAAAAALLEAAQRAGDPCLAALYRALGEENQAHAAQLRAFLELS